MNHHTSYSRAGVGVRYSVCPPVLYVGLSVTLPLLSCLLSVSLSDSHSCVCVGRRIVAKMHASASCVLWPLSSRGSKCGGVCTLSLLRLGQAALAVFRSALPPSFGVWPAGCMTDFKGDDKKDTTRNRPAINYVAESVIGRGSFGIVYQASVVETGETVAIKKVLQDRRYHSSLHPFAPGFVCVACNRAALALRNHAAHA